MPDRLPSLILLVGCWVPPAVIGHVAAEIVDRSSKQVRPALINGSLAFAALASTAAWFLFQWKVTMPPYIPGANPVDPTFAPPEAVAGLAVVSSVLVLPVSVLACVWAYRMRRRALGRTSLAGTSF